MPPIASLIRCRPVDAALKHVDGIHLGPLHPDDIAPEVFTRFDRADAQAALDIQGLVRSCGRYHPAALLNVARV